MRNLHSQTVRICIVLAVFIFIALWQQKFVLSAIGANPILNLIIFGTCFFGLALIYNALCALRNEYRAFYCLVELYDDLRSLNSGKTSNASWRYLRCREPAIVFKKPVILGPSYQLVSEQLYSAGEFAISASTMQTLIEGVDERLADMKGIISYVAGTLVFLGLIGTFIGLMVTLSSVGDILGSLDLSGGDPAETVSGLMTSLQTPLRGMATGFSSSLFGLVTSLTLSLLLQLVSKSGAGLKTDFSEWISVAVEIHEGLNNTGQDSTPANEASRMEERRLELVMRTAKHVTVNTQKNTKSISAFDTSINQLAKYSTENKEQLGGILDGLHILAEQNKVLHTTLARTVDSVIQIKEATNNRQEVEELTKLMSIQMNFKDKQLLRELKKIYRCINALDTQITTEEYEQELEAHDLIGELSDATKELSIEQLQRKINTIYEAQAEQNSAVVGHSDEILMTKNGTKG